MTRSPSTTLPAMITAGVEDQVNVKKKVNIKKMVLLSKIMHIVGDRKRGKGLLQTSLQRNNGSMLSKANIYMHVSSQHGKRYRQLSLCNVNHGDERIYCIMQ